MSKKVRSGDALAQVSLDLFRPRVDDYLAQVPYPFGGHPGQRIVTGGHRNAPPHQATVNHLEEISELLSPGIEPVLAGRAHHVVVNADLHHVPFRGLPRRLFREYPGGPARDPIDEKSCIPTRSTFSVSPLIPKEQYPCESQPYEVFSAASGATSSLTTPPPHPANTSKPQRAQAPLHTPRKRTSPLRSLIPLSSATIWSVSTNQRITSMSSPKKLE